MDAKLYLLLARDCRRMARDVRPDKQDPNGDELRMAVWHLRLASTHLVKVAEAIKAQS